MADTNNSDRALNNQREEELIEIDENGIVHTLGRTPIQLKSTVLRDPEGEFGPVDISSDQLTLTPAQSISANRWAYEREKLRMFPSFKFIAIADEIIAAEGTLDTQYNNTYGIRIELNNYPFRLPSVRLKDYVIHHAAPHRFNDGCICLMRSAQWQTHFTVALIVAKTAVWLGKYEIWKRNGHFWPGLGQSH